MVIRETELGVDTALDKVKREAGLSEIDTAVAYEKALGIHENFMSFVRGERPQFIAYFVHEVKEQDEIETHFRRLLGLEAGVSEEPLLVLQIEDTTLFRWSNVFDGEAFDAIYEARRLGQMPELYRAASTDQTVQTD